MDDKICPDKERLCNYSGYEIGSEKLVKQLTEATRSP